ncbi:hypothetical protein [Jannaschia seohaensis]|uniref:Uncharacterized protein n=1 Tax=Jannaschia seohaensis TaxID=475081 RepID=A0A2Y9ARZ2_9RHOB|nr:hypothetical protein [Jannaschia seohaensis]PWJ18329.1 hypothetical protein BCF38_105318 [Jannaschia seohaensis]SSA46855.1 hypothetical protein SAMN05421539_105318 [Jannaschia seohaensis]
MRLSLFLLAATALPAAAEIVPRDGTWTVRAMEAQMAEACPPMFQPMADAMVAQMGQRDVFEVDWPDAFDPNRASGLDPDGQPVAWERVDDTTWRAALSGPGTEAVIGTMQVLSETEISNRVEMDIQKMMEEQGGMVEAEGCTLSMTFLMELKD